MTDIRAAGAAHVVVLALLATVPTGVAASEKVLDGTKILDVIDIRRVVARHDVGNALGLAFDPDADVLYLAHGSDPRGGFIYTLDLEGNLLYELDLQLAYLPEAFPLSLSYDESSEQLFVLVSTPDASDFSANILVLDPASFSRRAVLSGDIGNGSGIHVTRDGIWQVEFPEDVILRYTLLAQFIEDVPLADSFPGFPGPLDLTSSFSGGFFVVDFFGERIVEVDMAGRELAAASTAGLGDGRGLAIDSDVESRRIFLQVNNEEIYVLSSDFLGRPVELVSIDIRPGRSTNTINPRGTGRMRVAILSTGAAAGSEAFDATAVDPQTVRFGRSDGGAPPVRHTFSDIDRDGDTDMVLLFELQDTGIVCGDPAGALTGETYAGQAIRGTDRIRTVGCKPPPQLSRSEQIRFLGLLPPKRVAAGGGVTRGVTRPAADADPTPLLR